MCLWCGNSLIAESLTSGFSRCAPNRRRFMAYAVSAGAAVAGITAVLPAEAADGAGNDRDAMLEFHACFHPIIFHRWFTL